MKIACIGYRAWAIDIYKEIQLNASHQYLNQKSLEDFSQHDIEKFDPDLILFYGWSWIVPDSLIDHYTCLMLHPSPLPLFRGGSPIQNQIIRGIKKSKVSIIIMTKEIDAGPLLGQEDLSLEGDLEDIFSEITEKGIKITKNIIDNGLKPKQQNHALATFYKRRKPEESEITIDELKNSSAEYLHNKIRMLQDPYPNAFIKTFDGKKLFLTASRIQKENL